MTHRIVSLAAVLLLAVVPVAAEPAKKVFVLGVDGLDPKLLQQYMDRDLMPNVKRLAAKGDFKPLTTSMPPLSPVAWSNFTTGMDPGGHGVFDFVHRDPETVFPMRAESGAEPGSVVEIGGCNVLPYGGGPKNLRQGRAFWQILEDHDVPTVVYKMPANFPPVESDGKALSGMGTPDLLGTPGTFSFFTDRYVPNAANFSGGEAFRVQVVDDHVAAKLKGPPHPFRDQTRAECKANLEVGFDVYLDPERPVAKIDVQGHEFVLQQGEWSDWVQMQFKTAPLLPSVSSIARFYLKQVRPQFELYVSPLQIDPSNPGAMQLSTPHDWSHELCEELGFFYTQELAEDTKALTYGVLDGHEFWDQTQFIFHESQRAFDHLLKDFNEGLFFFYFSSIDQNSHALWNYTDPQHPGYEEDEMLAGSIESLYIELDEVVGRALAAIDDETTFIIMSDHGFAPFYWQVNLNSWLLEQGYVALINPDDRSQPVFMNVDWNRTKAYALGLNGIYVNLRGREGRGIVNQGKEHELLLAELEEALLEMVDPRNGRNAVSLVVNTRRDFHGPFVEEGPDLLVGYDYGYRSSWDSPLGEFPKEIFIDNKDPWSGDHSMDYRQVPGVLISNRPITLEQPALYDLTVAILDEYGVAKPEEMIGQDCLGD